MASAYRRLRALQVQDHLGKPRAVILAEWLDYTGPDTFEPAGRFLQTAEGGPVLVDGPGMLRVESTGEMLYCSPADCDLYSSHHTDPAPG